GYGGGIFLTGNGNYNAQSEKLDLHGMKILDNSASNSGQSLFVAISKLKEWCRYGINGDYVKGDYDDTLSNDNELEGIPINQNSFISLTRTQIENATKPLEYYWSLPYQDIWHVQSGSVQSITGNDQQWCGNIDEPCETIQYALERISVRKGGLSTTDIYTENKIGINELGYELLNPIQFKPTSSQTTKINIMKQLNGTSFEIQGQSEIKILKNNEISKENGKQGWISTVDGLQLGI
ncbi:MAG: hypothetical protein EZS28_054241, partial [Streblomastix strix]